MLWLEVQKHKQQEQLEYKVTNARQQPPVAMDNKQPITKCSLAICIAR